MKGSGGYFTLVILAGKISSMKEIWGTQAEQQNPEKLGENLDLFSKMTEIQGSTATLWQCQLSFMIHY